MRIISRTVKFDLSNGGLHTQNLSTLACRDSFLGFGGGFGASTTLCDRVSSGAVDVMINAKCSWEL